MKSIKLLKEKGIKFEHRNVKNGQWQDLKPYGFVRKKQNTELEKEISMIVKKLTRAKRQKASPQVRLTLTLQRLSQPEVKKPKAARLTIPKPRLLKAKTNNPF